MTVKYNLLFKLWLKEAGREEKSASLSQVQYQPQINTAQKQFSSNLDTLFHQIT